MYPVRLDLYEMRRLLLLLIFLSNVSAASSAADGRLLCDTITSGGIVREFKLYMPDGIRRQSSCCTATAVRPIPGDSA